VNKDVYKSIIIELIIALSVTYGRYQDVKLLQWSAVRRTFVKYLSTSVRNLPFTIEQKQMKMDNFVQPVDFRVIQDCTSLSFLVHNMAWFYGVINVMLCFANAANPQKRQLIFEVHR